MKVIRKRLTADEITPPNTRLHDNVVQFTPDGGVTWIDQPGLDPRTSDAYQVPANPTENPRCDAATRAITLMHQQLDGVIDALTAAQAVNFLFDLALLLIPGFGIIAEAIWLVVEALLFIGQTAIDESFTDAVYDELICLWMCRVGDDGVMTAEGLAGFQDDVQAEWPTDAVIPAVISLICDDFGRIMFNNAAATRTETGDCETCDCTPCVLALGGDGQNGWEPVDEYGCDVTYNSSLDIIENTAPCPSAPAYIFTEAERAIDFAWSTLTVHVVGNAVNADRFGRQLYIDNVLVTSSVTVTGTVDEDVSYDFTGSPKPAGTVKLRYYFTNNAGTPNLGDSYLNFTKIDVCP